MDKQSARDAASGHSIPKANNNRRNPRNVNKLAKMKAGICKAWGIQDVDQVFQTYPDLKPQRWRESNMGVLLKIARRTDRANAEDLLDQQAARRLTKKGGWHGKSFVSKDAREVLKELGGDRGKQKPLDLVQGSGQDAAQLNDKSQLDAPLEFDEHSSKGKGLRVSPRSNKGSLLGLPQAFDDENDRDFSMDDDDDSDVNMDDSDSDTNSILTDIPAPFIPVRQSNSKSDFPATTSREATASQHTQPQNVGAPKQSNPGTWSGHATDKFIGSPDLGSVAPALHRPSFSDTEELKARLRTAAPQQSRPQSFLTSEQGIRGRSSASFTAQPTSIHTSGNGSPIIPSFSSKEELKTSRETATSRHNPIQSFATPKQHNQGASSYPGTTESFGTPTPRSAQSIHVVGRLCTAIAQAVDALHSAEDDLNVTLAKISKNNKIISVHQGQLAQLGAAEKCLEDLQTDTTPVSMIPQAAVPNPEAGDDQREMKNLDKLFAWAREGKSLNQEALDAADEVRLELSDDEKKKRRALEVAQEAMQRVEQEVEAAPEKWRAFLKDTIQEAWLGGGKDSDGKV